MKFANPPVYYDASYGVTYSSLAEIDNSALDGYYKIASVNVDEVDVGMDLNGNGTVTDVSVQVLAVLFHPNPTDNQLVEEAYEYP